MLTCFLAMKRFLPERLFEYFILRSVGLPVTKYNLLAHSEVLVSRWILNSTGHLPPEATVSFQ